MLKGGREDGDDEDDIGEGIYGCNMKDSLATVSYMNGWNVHGDRLGEMDDVRQRKFLPRL